MLYDLNCMYVTKSLSKGDVSKWFTLYNENIFNEYLNAFHIKRLHVIVTKLLGQYDGTNYFKMIKSLLQKY